MRPNRIVMASPALNDDLGLAQSVEDLAAEQLIAKAGVEALDVAVLPRTAPLDIGNFGADSGDPSLDSLGDELRSVVGPDVTGNAAQDEQIGENVDDIDCFELASDTDRQAFVGKLVNDIEHAISASIVGAVLDKVVGPDVIAVLRPQPDARSVGQPQPASFGLFIGDLQPLASPDALDPLVVNYPARLAQQFGDLAIAVAAVCRASSIISAVRRSSSSRPRGILRCVERCCPSAAQARRSETCSCARTCSMQARRRAGLRSFPGQPSAEWAYPASDRKPPCAAGCSRAQGPSGASPARSSTHRTPAATDNTSPRSPRSDGLHPPCSGPARPEHRPAAASRRSLQACIASLPLQSSWISKTYLKSDHFNGGGSLTPENITRQWIMFEAGAIARGVSKDRVCPILFGIKKSALKGPLQFRQSVEFTEGDFRKLLKTINNGRIGETDLNVIFNTWWPSLKQSIDAINAAPQPVLKEPSDNELLQEILGVTRNLVIEHQKLTQVLTQGGLTDVEAVVRALLLRDARLQRGLRRE